MFAVTNLEDKPGLALSLWCTQIASVTTGAPWEFRAWKPVQIRQVGAMDMAVPMNEGFVGRELDTYNHSPWAPHAFFLFPRCRVESYDQYISAQADKSEFLSNW